MLDLFMSRREYPLFCKYWSVKDSKSDELLPSKQTSIGMTTQNSIIRKRMQDGAFYAKLETEVKENNEAIGGVFLINSEHITISTPDLKKGELKNNDLVVINEEEYFVEGIDRQLFRQQQLEIGNMGNASYLTFIRLRK